MSFSRVITMPGRPSRGAALAALLAFVSTGTGPPVDAHAASGSVGAAIPERSEVAAVTWGACGWRTSNEKVVRIFTRVRGDDGAGHVLRGGSSRLLCGDEGGGYRHLFNGHKNDWDHDGAIGGVNWRDHADWSIDVALNDPDVVTYRLNKRNGKANFCYSRQVELWDVGHRRHVTDRIILVALKADTADIITAYPTGRQCTVGNADQ